MHTAGNSPACLTASPIDPLEVAKLHAEMRVSDKNPAIFQGMLVLSRKVKNVLCYANKTIGKDFRPSPLG